MNYQLEIVFRQNVEPSYPMGDPEKFESIDEFLNFNYEQINLIVDNCPYFKEVERKLRSGDYSIEEHKGIIYVIVMDIDLF